jgi:hypothetical protein
LQVSALESRLVHEESLLTAEGSWSRCLELSDLLQHIEAEVSVGAGRVKIEALKEAKPNETFCCVFWALLVLMASGGAATGRGDRDDLHPR